ncbi:hypothetical protein CDD81_3265 [Ophiocordyceps australis]|uniref:Disintegrin and metalloproteinase domain-containing protein B n=1 Tax=Ophiocordyceps australis TaxID=1399860 RepID=A0A2C5YDT0_9HYPO|nr:hypothetical protein CDD81_3265 [Ophiocordyceps australis]
MVALPSIVTALASFLLLASHLLAFSTRRNQPISYVSLIEDAVIKTPSHRAHSHSKFDLYFSLHNGQEKIRLALDPNDDLIHQDFAITYLDIDGNVREVQRPPRSEHKVYRGDAFVERQGQVGWFKAGWARITVHEDGKQPLFDGAFRVDGDTHHIATGREYVKLRHDNDPDVQVPPADMAKTMVVWRDSDILTAPMADDRTELKRSVEDTSSLCDADSLSFNANFDSQLQSGNALAATSVQSLFGRQMTGVDAGGNAGVNVVDSIGSLDGCPTTRKVALVGIVTDCNYMRSFGNMTDLRKNVISMVNKASEVYESTFKISLGIQNLTVTDKACPAAGSVPAQSAWNVDCQDKSVNISDRLNLFSQWRGQFSDSNAYWSLLTMCATDSAVGLAWRGQLCRQGASGNSGASGGSETVAAANVVVRTSNEWQIFAHETGHTFGAIHDCTATSCRGGGDGGTGSGGSSLDSSCCPLSSTQCDAKGKFIMNPSTEAGITQFSRCSIGNICSGLKSTMVKGNCLTSNKNIKVITDSQCGNGIVEAGEDCDCGGQEACNGNPCCDAKTCKFTTNSVCDPSNEDCCTPQCRFASTGTVCRPSTGECDPAETCPGDSATCPEDAHREDTASCGDGLECASGQCTSRDLQCKSMMSSLLGINQTRACGQSRCMLACQSPERPGGCTYYTYALLDGTSCGGGGKCVDGSCRGSSTFKEIGQWIRQHKAVFIPVVAVVGGLILIAMLSCAINSIRRRVRRRRVRNKVAANGVNGWPAPANAAPAAMARQQMAARRQWSDSSSGPMIDGRYDYPLPPAPPPPPPPAMPPNYPSQWHPQRSMRYA